MTQASRRMRIEAEMSRYKRVIIRVQFPDRLVMQALFRTTETGSHLFYSWYISPLITVAYLYNSTLAMDYQSVHYLSYYV